jgi:prepilin-type N-terminal cleavage/methylation domain-containing protein
MKIIKRTNKGFTLIELLVVVAIISLLSSVIFANLNVARAKGRDAKRLAEVHSLQVALELYYNDNGQYPPVCGAASNGTYAAAWPTLLSSSYISSMPIDPTNTVNYYGYYYCMGYVPNGKCSYTATGSAKNYMLATRLENPSTISSACSGTFGGWDNLGYLNYIVGSN